jgi:hypothetical protein
MNIWTIENGEPVLYVREGQCNQCGECCCNHKITYSMAVGLADQDAGNLDPSKSSWDEWEGYSVFFAQGIWWYIKIISIEDDEGDVCPAFDEETGLCTDWQDPEMFRPICRYWPFHPSNIERFRNCGFSFRRVEVEGNEKEA